jgi:hypothetical protein
MSEKLVKVLWKVDIVIVLVKFVLAWISTLGDITFSKIWNKKLSVLFDVQSIKTIMFQRNLTFWIILALVNVLIIGMWLLSSNGKKQKEDTAETKVIIVPQNNDSTVKQHEETEMKVF